MHVHSYDPSEHCLLTHLGNTYSLLSFIHTLGVKDTGWTKLPSPFLLFLSYTHLLSCSFLGGG